MQSGDKSSPLEMSCPELMNHSDESTTRGATTSGETVPSPTERTATKTSGATGEPQATRASPKRPPSVRRPPPPSKKAHTDPKPEVKMEIEPPVSEEKHTDKEGEGGRHSNEGESKNKQSGPPKKPPAVRRPPPPTVRPVPKQRSRSETPEPQEQDEKILLPREAPQTPTGGGGEKEAEASQESAHMESKSTPVKRLPSVSRPPPPSKRPNPAEEAKQPTTAQMSSGEAANTTTTPPKRPPAVAAIGRPLPPRKKQTETDDTAIKPQEMSVDAPLTKSEHLQSSSDDSVKDLVGGGNDEDMEVEQPPQAQSPTETDRRMEQMFDTPSENHKEEKEKVTAPAVKKQNVLDEDRGDLNGEKPSQPAMPQASMKKPSIERPPPPAMPKKPPVRRDSQEIKPVESHKFEETTSKELTIEKPEEVHPNFQAKPDSPKEPDVRNEIKHSPGPKRPAPPTNKKLSIKKPPTTPSPQQTKQVHFIENEREHREAASEEPAKGKEDESEENSAELQTLPSTNSKQEPKEVEVSEKKPDQHSPRPKRPTPPMPTKKLSIKKPPPPSMTRKPSVKSKPSEAPAAVKKEETVEDWAEIWKEGHEISNETTQQPDEDVKKAHPVIVEPPEGEQGEVQSSINSQAEPTEKITMTVVDLSGRKSPNSGRKSPNLTRKSPTLRKKSKHPDQESDEEVESSVKIIKYPSGSSLTNSTNGKAAEAEGEYY